MRLANIAQNGNFCYDTAMIGTLKGIVAETNSKYIILEAGHVGYKVFVTLDTFEKLKKDRGQETHLWTYLAVRDNALDLYGFLSKEAQEFFELLITVSGIGPKSAISILSIATLENLRRAISSDDTSYLTKVSGIGKKTAEKIVRELREKIGAIEGEASVGGQEEADAIEALQSLGYSREESRDVLKKIDPSITDAGKRVKAALKHLGKQN